MKLAQNKSVMKQLFIGLALTLLALTSCRDTDGPATPIPPKADNTEVNEAPYDILLSNTVMEEKYEPGYVVGSLAALDPNTSDEHDFLLVNGPGSQDNDLFDIQDTNLVIEEVFNYGPQSTFTIRIWCTDGEFEFEKIFEINLIPYIPEAPVITSIHFLNDSLMPAFVAADSTNVNPQIEINQIPRLTEYFAISMRDLDAGDAWHWSAWNIPVAKDTILEGETWAGFPTVVVGDSDFGPGYQGPAPPSEHTYEFTVYCLTDSISLMPDQYANLPASFDDKLVISATLRGTYEP